LDNIDKILEAFTVTAEALKKTTDVLENHTAKILKLEARMDMFVDCGKGRACQCKKQP
jgi:hypothetical protein